MDFEEQYAVSQEERLRELEVFRERWRQELCVLVPNVSSASHSQNSSSGEFRRRSRLEIAEEMFREGIKEERSGRLQEAVSLYRRAMQLDPDIEAKVDKHVDGKVRQKRPEVVVEKDQEVPENVDPGYEDEPEDEENILERLLQFNAYQTGICSVEQRDLAVTGSHISVLPYEMLQYVLQWVISSELDFISLENFARVCRGFYKVSREPLIWKMACQRIWGDSCGKLEEMRYSSWREMLIKRPQVRFNGVYISRVYYARAGECSFMDQRSNYRPWHTVMYFRYFRFFADGTVLYANTPEEPVAIVGRMRSKYIIPSKDQAQINIGRYMMSASGDSVIIFVKREKVDHGYGYSGRSKKVHISTETLNMELGIRDSRDKLHGRLEWRRFGMNRVVRDFENQTRMDINHQQFPPLHFSRVKSYTSVPVEAPLR